MPYVIGSHEGVLIFHALRFPLIVLVPPLPSRDWKGGPVTLSGIDYLSGPRPFRLFLPTVNANLVFVILHSDAEFSFASAGVLRCPFMSFYPFKDIQNPKCPFKSL